MSGARWALLLVAIVLMVGVVDLVRRRRLREEFSWLWIGIGIVLLALAAFGPGLADAFAVDPGVMLAVAIGCLAMVVVLDLSIRVSSLENRLKNLTQELALVQKRTQDLEGSEADDG